jgi:ubiquinone/menaquinone biosynthesis C-methylase UbiE
MQLTEAITLIKPAVQGQTSKVTWLDLGCGDGLFTKALASLLMKGKIFAVDLEIHQIKSPKPNDVHIEFVKLDFVRSPLPFAGVDGILMANSLHYVEDKKAFIEKAKVSLGPGGGFIIIEYDTDRANQWVPYPVTFEKMKNIFLSTGFGRVEKIGERSSIYRSGKMYACSIRR